jgi:hypothetical protein
VEYKRESSGTMAAEVDWRSLRRPRQRRDGVVVGDEGCLVGGGLLGSGVSLVREASQLDDDKLNCRHPAAVLLVSWHDSRSHGLE